MGPEQSHKVLHIDYMSRDNLYWLEQLVALKKKKYINIYKILSFFCGKEKVLGIFTK